MKQENRISLNIGQEDIIEIIEAIKVLQNKLLPYLTSLSNEEQISMVKMSDENIAFIENCKDFMEQNPELAPQYISLEDMQLDIDALNTLRKLNNPIVQISSAINDAMMLSGSEAYAAAISFYYFIKGAANMKVAGAKNICDELKKQFIKNPNRRKNTENIINNN